MADLDILRNSGMGIDGLSDEEKAALALLDDSDLAALAAVRDKLNSGGEVSGYQAPARAADGIVVW